jgi:hypothetical protein
VKYFKHIIICFVILSCSQDKDDDTQSLATYIQGKTTKKGAVIACAASHNVTGNILTFYYPEEGATYVRFFETISTDLDENNFSNYHPVSLNSEPVFNGHLGVFEQDASHEKWIVVTFELNNEIKISNPIRSKQITKPTLWNDDVSINQSQLGMPFFNWMDNPVGDNAIYFQVLSDAQNNLLSGTYTYENEFQFYKTDNVVLNVTTQPVPDLISQDIYNFTLMDVSEDNWVNWVIQKSFTSE